MKKRLRCPSLTSDGSKCVCVGGGTNSLLCHTGLIEKNVLVYCI